ncbi:hypothetical protein AD45P2_00075 [Alteromonas phage vB_AmaP_AD45-P2]|uniref:Uncharacterized protein n=1 Tax=Pseudorhizobium pelagicum TaxID=1509405 RepID=A0A922NX37_9HYPH|nr:hypothetical protein [Pseudorhizobium pelagicum]YP_008125987.1 hypothetical protein M610_gp016 [Alteromonas phage vB_AmaP_AD45-P1]AGM46953.1 hypothetical protein AD45P3_00075 [Alteromonas phage vB_AmaP_AD45-P3]AGM47070.1 hypothetical protein AD45P4_00075 [Alteromonas phage vB_AmaP_AD45-P4]AGM47186.1 hypothetical protein AD45P2_00075 [Alteromonas phage vB_AmaP_AD45-P2]AGM46834.1 hypothetical protein AD45P1_00080 [Alteromonas phage vB_AmaP_AD45-P1]KEQ05575.1 hypothetical protein GV68_08575 [
MSIESSNDVRDAVIKLEAKMEVMSESMISMADSVAKLADLRFELHSVRKDIDVITEKAEKTQTEVDELKQKIAAVEKVQDKNSYVIGKIELFWGALITGSAAFLWWLLKK